MQESVEEPLFARETEEEIHAVIELKYLDPAGSTLLQRVLEPADYGFPQKPAILPAGESLTAQIKMEGTLSFAATAAQVKPVVDAGR